MGKLIAILLIAVSGTMTPHVRAADVFLMNSAGLHRFNPISGDYFGSVFPHIPLGFGYRGDGALCAVSGAELAGARLIVYLPNGTIEQSGNLPLVGGFATDANGAIYTGGMLPSGATCVYRFDGLTPTFFTTLPTSPHQIRTMMFGPDGDLYVTGAFVSNGRAVVKRFDGVTGAAEGDFAIAPTTGGAFAGFTFGPDGDLYVTRSNTHSILRYQGETGAFLGDFIAPGAGGLSQPADLVFQNDGSVYVIGSNTLNRFDGMTGQFISRFSTLNTIASGSAHIRNVLPEPSACALMTLLSVVVCRRRCRDSG